jgi:hypothetical protein
MLVRVVRVPSMPGGLSLVVDDHPECPVIWVLEEDYSSAAAAMLESAMNVSIWYWDRKPAAARARLRAV